MPPRHAPAGRHPTMHVSLSGKAAAICGGHAELAFTTTQGAATLPSALKVATQVRDKE